MYDTVYSDIDKRFKQEFVDGLIESDHEVTEDMLPLLKYVPAILIYVLIQIRQRTRTVLKGGIVCSSISLKPT